MITSLAKIDVNAVSSVKRLIKQDQSADIGMETGCRSGQSTVSIDAHEPANTPPPVPVEAEITRPGFATHDDWFAVDDKHMRPGLYWHGWTEPKGNAVAAPIDSWVCSPIHAEAMTEGVHGGDHGLLLRFMTPRGRWQEWAAPMAMLKGFGEELRGELLDQGVRIDPKNRALLAHWLMDQYPRERIIAAKHTGWHEGAFVLPGRTIGDASVRFQSAYAQQEEFAQDGSRTSWRDNIAAHCSENPMLILAICVSLAGPLLKRARLQPRGGAIVHLMGDSSKGKSVAAQVAASVWGPPEFVRSWLATGNGLEAVAAALNDTVLILDEIGQCDPREIGAIVYMVGNGSGKNRASRSGGARKSENWRVMGLSNGEHALAGHMASGGYQSKAGQGARMLDIPATDRAHGLFDELHGFNDGRAFADHLMQATAVDYGHAGPAFIEKLLAEDADLPAFYAQLCEHPEFCSEDSLAGRVGKWFALVAMAGEMAIEYKIAPWHEGEALEAAVAAFDLWKSQRNTGSTEDAQILEGVRRFIDRHGDSRFSPLDNTQTLVVRDRAGYTRDGKSGREYLFTADGLAEAVPGFQIKRVLDALASAGWLTEREKDSRSIRVTVARNTTRVYAIRPVGEASP